MTTAALKCPLSPSKKSSSSSIALDTGEARDRSVRRALQEASDGDRHELTFRDANGQEHDVRSCVLPDAGRYVYDASDAWGLRALGRCRDDAPEQITALATDYAGFCAARSEPPCRPLVLSDIRPHTNALPEEAA